MVYLVVMYGYERWTIKKTEHQRTDVFELWCWRRLLRVPFTARKSNQSIQKQVSPEYSLEGLILKLNTLIIWCKELTHLKRPWCWERLKAGGERDDRGQDGWMASAIQWTKYEQAPGDGEGQRSLACCSPWGHKELDTTEWLNWTELNTTINLK